MLDTGFFLFSEKAGNVVMKILTNSQHISKIILSIIIVSL